MTSTPQTHPTAIRTLKALMALLLAIAAAIQIWLLPAISAVRSGGCCHWWRRLRCSPMRRSAGSD